jgi:transposase-like protein
MEAYTIINREDKRELAGFLAREGQLLLPMVGLIEQAELAIDELVDVLGKATIEAVLQLSAQQIAGTRHPGKASGEVRWHGCQPGTVTLSQRKLRVNKPRLRRKLPAEPDSAQAGGRPGGRTQEVEIPAYTAMQTNGKLAGRMLEILMQGVSTRRYKKVLPAMAETVGISKSAVSRQTMVAGEKLLKDLAERNFGDKDILIIYIDGFCLSSHHVLCAVGVDAQGIKHVLGLRQGASENATVVKDLLADLVARGVKPGVKRLFVIDGAKALRAGIDAVYGAENPVQRCRNHKIRNVLDYLPQDQRDQGKATLKAAFKLDAKEGIAKLEQYACWLERENPGAAGSVREGLDELFTINRLDLPATLRRCLATTNLIDSSHSGTREKLDRVKHWQDGEMALRWTATAMLETEKNFRKIMGHHQLWMLTAHLRGKNIGEEVDSQRKIA